MPDPQQTAPDVVIVDDGGTEHHFPAGFDVRHAIAIVRNHGDSSLPTKPVSAEDFTKPSAFQQATGQLKDVGIGVAKGAGSSLAGLAELATNAGLIPGVPSSAFNSDMRPPVLQRAQQLTTATNTPQLIGKGLEMAAELAPTAIQVGRAIPAVAKSGGGAALDVASHVPYIGRPARFVRAVLGMLPEDAAAASPPRAPMGEARPPEFFTGQEPAPRITGIKQVPLSPNTRSSWPSGEPPVPQQTSSIQPTDNAFVNVDKPQPLPTDNPTGYHTGATGKGTGERMQSAHKIIKAEDANYQGAVADLKATVGPDFLKALLDSLNRGGR